MSSRIEALIKELLQALSSELDLLVRQRTLEALRSILEGRAVPVRRDRRPESYARVPDADELAGRIASAVAASPGQTGSEIGSATGARPAAVKKAIKAMLDSGQLRKSGQGRATRYILPSAARLPEVSAAKRRRRGKGRGRKAAGRLAPGARKARKTSKQRKAVLVPTRRRPTKRSAAAPAQQAEAPQLQLGPVPPEHTAAAGVPAFIASRQHTVESP